MPAMTLPESVAENSLSSSVPYGSLNESQFRRPRQGSLDARESFNRIGISSSYNPSVQLDIQKRVQDMKKHGTLIKNGKGGLASLLDKSEHEVDTNSDSIDRHENTLHHGGIGSIIQDRIDSTSGESTLESSAKYILADNQTLQTEQDETLLLHHQDIQYQTDFNDNYQDEAEETLSSSLTGLSILKSSKGTLLDLNDNEKEAMAQFSRSLNAQNGEYVSSSDKFRDVDTALSYLHDAHNVSALDSSWEERQDTQQQPSSDQQDDDGMFNMDME